MTDRAVVDDDEIKAKIRQRVRQLEDENDYAALMPQPRALVALSDDRRWLVVLEDGEWLAFQRKLEGFWFYVTLRADEGQDAQEVLRIFVTGRNATMNALREQSHVEMYQTALTCMAVDGGPEDCCGCFNGRQNGESIEFFCNECGRVVFNAVALKEPSHA